MKDFKKEIANNEAAAAPVKYAVPTVAPLPIKMKSKVGKESKSFQTFRNECDWLNVAMQITDCAITSVNKILVNNATRNSSQPMYKVLNVDNEIYSNLNHQVKQYRTVIGQTRNKQTEFGINHLYVIWTNFLKGVANEMIDKNTKISKALDAIVQGNKLSAIDLEDIKNSSSVRKTIVSATLNGFCKINSTRKLLLNINEYTQIKIQDTIMEEAFYYLDIRNLLVHNHRKINKKFYDKHRIKHPEIAVGNLIKMNFTLYQKSFDAIYKLCEDLDAKLIKHNFITAVH